MAERLNVGPLTLVYMALALALSAGVLFLGLVEVQTILISFVVFFLGGIALMVLSGQLGYARLGRLSSPLMLLEAIGITIIVLIIEGYLIFMAVGLNITGGIPLVVALYAIYEETFASGISAVLKKAGLPDLYVIVLNTVVFVPLHALTYAATIGGTLFLIGARVTLNSAQAVSDNTDVNYSAHLGYNILVAII